MIHRPDVRRSLIMLPFSLAALGAFALLRSPPEPKPPPKKPKRPKKA